LQFGNSQKNTDDNLKPPYCFIEKLGLEVVIGNTIGLSNDQLAGTDRADFQQQLDNQTLKPSGV
jgi:muramoyltetrapeptide carboxypeptidase